jgi:archaellum component FlaC
MLENQDLVVIREIVAEEIGAKTSDIRQDVSILKQDVSGLKQDVVRLDQKIDDFRDESKRHLHILIEEMKNTTKLVIEGVSSQIKSEVRTLGEEIDKKYEPRFRTIELALRKKSA